jgi:hypothetical protein
MNEFTPYLRIINKIKIKILEMVATSEGVRVQGGDLL